MWPDRARPGLCFGKGFKAIHTLASSRAARTFGAALILASALVFRAALADDSLPPGVQYASDTDPVRILSINYSPTEIKRGGTVVAQIVCTSNAAAVTAKVGTIVVNVPKQAPGIFRTSLTLPRLPLYDAHQTVTVTAIRTDGKTAHRTFTVDLK